MTAACDHGATYRATYDHRACIECGAPLPLDLSDRLTDYLERVTRAVTTEPGTLALMLATEPGSPLAPMLAAWRALPRRECADHDDALPGTWETHVYADGHHRIVTVCEAPA